MNTKEQKQDAVADSTTNTAGLIINFKNSTGQGYVTLNGWDNGDDSPPTDDGNPPVSNPAVANGANERIIDVNGGKYWVSTMYGGYYIYVNTKATSTWNMPNGTTLEIEWNIDPNDSGNNYCYFKNLNGAYTLSGTENPTESEGTYTYNVTLTMNS